MRVGKRGVGHSDAMAYSAKHGFEVGWLIKHCDKYGIGRVMQNSWYRAYKKYFNNSPLSKIYFVIFGCILNMRDSGFPVARMRLSVIRLQRNCVFMLAKR